MPAAPRTRKLLPVLTQKTRRALVIAHNHPQFFPGGAEIFAYDLFKALRAHTHYAPIFMAAAHHLPPHGGTAFMAAGEAADEFIFSGAAFDDFYQSHRTPGFMYDDFRNLLKNLRPDVIHFHHSLRVGLEALRIARDTLPDVKIIYTLHEFILMCYREGQMLRTNGTLCDKASPARCHECFPHASAAQFFMRELFIKAHLELVDRFIAPSEFLAARFVEWGLSSEKIQVMENGRHITEPAPHRALPTEGTRNRFAYFGQVNPYKGALLLLKAARRLVEQGFNDFQLDIFGNVEMQTDAFKQEFFALQKDCGACITFHGKYDNADLPRLMTNIDWVITPSLWWENSPLVIQEALMHQRPVICSNIGGMKEKVVHEKTGLHFTVGDEASLADTLRRAASEKNLWGRLVKNITPRLSIEHCARDHAALYDLPKSILCA